jgi:hypothetical protein
MNTGSAMMRATEVDWTYSTRKVNKEYIQYFGGNSNGEDLGDGIDRRIELKLVFVCVCVCVCVKS